MKLVSKFINFSTYNKLYNTHSNKKEYLKSENRRFFMFISVNVYYARLSLYNYIYIIYN